MSGGYFLTKLQPVRGTHDIYPDESIKRRQIIDRCRNVSLLYGFNEISTPIFEFSEVFERTLGDTSDIVSKEMYTFEDRSGAKLTLRPENTAGVARAVISGGLTQSLPLKFFYTGPMFRYERPQRARLRQFHQLGVELLGVPEPSGDIEIISLAAQSLESIDILNKTTLELNSLGDIESRLSYRNALTNYFDDHRKELSEESISRLERNPLRILDSKDEGDKAVISKAPDLSEFLNSHSKIFFTQVCDGLSSLDIKFKHNPRLVRGLDYYCHTAFEFITHELGAQGAVLAGGRYDNLLDMMGGPPTAGVGWAAGIERLAALTNITQSPLRPFSIIPLGEGAEQIAQKLTLQFRRAGLPIDLGYRGNLSKRMKRANNLNSYAAIIIGDDEIKAGEATVRDLDTGIQSNVLFENLLGELEHRFSRDGKDK